MTSEECLKNARECMEQADWAIDTESKGELLKIAEEWTRLAAELEELQKLAGVFPFECTG
jgi:hypothetical protein